MFRLSHPVAQFLERGVEHLAAGFAESDVASPYRDRSRTYDIVLHRAQVLEDLVHVVRRVLAFS